MNQQCRRVLFVDDEPNILKAMERQLRSEIELETALGPEAALEALSNRGPFAVVVSDMQMPGMNGIELLKRIRGSSPDTVSIMLTGNADQGTAVNAVNDGQIYRFLRKPCSAEEVLVAVEAALQQNLLLTSKRELLEKTVSGSIRLLTDILSMVDPVGFGAAQRTKAEASRIARALGETEVWKIETAALLARIGQVAAPKGLVEKAAGPAPLTTAESDIVDRFPQVAHDLLCHIPHLGDVANIVLYQEKRFDGIGFPRDEVKGVSLPLGARILKPLHDRQQLDRKIGDRQKSLTALQLNASWYDPEVLAEIVNPSPDLVTACGSRPRRLSVNELRPGQSLLEDVKTKDGTLLIGQGNVVSEALCERLHNYARLGLVVEPIHVLVPDPADEATAA